MNIFCIFISLGFLVVSLIFIKKRRLEFQYSLLWSAVSMILLVLSFNKKFVQYIADCVEIVYAPALLFLVGIILCFLMIFYLMIVISDINKKIRRLIQENALLNDKVNERLM